ncbi:MAG: HXXEE domain-containing protein [Candidatus Saccharimonadales bacterium]
MNKLRNHWFQVGFGLAIASIISLLLWHNQLSSFRILLGVSLITLFLHQFEEYQLPGGFPRMINKAMFNSKQTDRYPLNSNTALIINTTIGWLLYILAFIFAEHAVWLVIASILVSVGNVIAHVLLFNIKGKTLYNPGMATALLLFLPLSIYFFIFIAQHSLVHPSSLIVGLILGVIINYFGVLRLITLLANKNTPFVFK